MTFGDRARIVILSLIALGTALLALRIHRTEQRAEASYAAVNLALEQRRDALDHFEARLLRSQILQTHLDECFEYSDSTLNSVERDPCRFVCTTLAQVPLPTSMQLAVELQDVVLWESELDEAICGDLQ